MVRKTNDLNEVFEYSIEPPELKNDDVFTDFKNVEFALTETMQSLNNMGVKFVSLNKNSQSC